MSEELAFTSILFLLTFCFLIVLSANWTVGLLFHLGRQQKFSYSEQPNQFGATSLAS